MNAGLTHVSTIVLNWNGRHDTAACLGALTRSQDVAPEVIVVDNASSDGSVGHIKSLYPSVEIIQAGANLGYAGGVNRGIRAALERDAHWVFLINNDATVRPTTIRGLVAAAQGRDRVAAVMPLIVFSHDPSLVWFAGASFDPRRSRPGRVEGYREPLPLRQPVSRQIDRITGAAVLLRAKALRDVGLFDEQLFFQYEDVDWSLRARQRGWEIHFDPSAVVEHKVAGSSGGERSRLSRYYATRNHLVIQDRHGPTTPGRSALREIATVAPGLLRCLLPSGGGLGSATATLAGWRDYRRGRLGQRVDV